MANTNLTIDMITNQALMILHQKLNFIGSVNRQYDASFAKSGAKIGDTLRVRLPNEYTVRSGATLSAQDTTETSVALPVTNQKGVDVNFSSEELTMDIDSFSERILEPAMSVLAANIEHDMMDSVYKEVYNFVDNTMRVALTWTRNQTSIWLTLSRACSMLKTNFLATTSKVAWLVRLLALTASTKTPCGQLIPLVLTTARVITLLTAQAKLARQSLPAQKVLAR